MHTSSDSFVFCEAIYYTYTNIKMPALDRKRSRTTAGSSSDDERRLPLSEKIRKDIIKQLDRYTDAVNLESATGTRGVAELQDQVESLQQELANAEEKTQTLESLRLDTEGLSEQAIRGSIDYTMTDRGRFSSAETSEIVRGVSVALQAYAREGHSDLQTIPDTFVKQFDKDKYDMCCGFGMKMRLRGNRMNIVFPSKNHFRITIYKH
ncbi:unnamed protein product [Amoebophrya sp. A120]|nr:unnamed protein product [Amoebophrya sp. A120]|eukprot:GSA120T00005645001.1